jgi:hypothetical protein
MVKQLTVSDLVDMAIKDAPPTKTEQTKTATATVVGNKFIKLAETLECLSLEKDAQESSSLQTRNSEQIEKRAQIDKIVETYIGLER